MAQIRFTYPTNLPPIQVQQRIKRFAAYLQREANIATTWQPGGAVAHIVGKYYVNIDAWLAIRQGGVEVAAADPGLLFRGKAEGYLKEKLGQYLNPTVPLAQLP